MIEHLRMPLPEKMRRNRLLIEALSTEIYMFGGGDPFRRHSNWRTDYQDYKEMLRKARKIMNIGIRVEVDAAGFGGEAGSQFMVIAHSVRTGTIDLIEKAAVNIYAREQKTKGVSGEEMRQIYEEAELVHADIDRVWAEKVIPRLPRTVEQIRSSILNKIFSPTD